MNKRFITWSLISRYTCSTGNRRCWVKNLIIHSIKILGSSIKMVCLQNFRTDMQIFGNCQKKRCLYHKWQYQGKNLKTMAMVLTYYGHLCWKCWINNSCWKRIPWKVCQWSKKWILFSSVLIEEKYMFIKYLHWSGKLKRRKSGVTFI